MNKKFDFDTKDQALAASVRALGHPARLVILKQLAQRRECVSGEIIDIWPLAPATVSQHLLELKKAGWLQGQVLGRKSNYCINWENVSTMEEEIREFLDVLMSLKTECKELQSSKVLPEKSV